MVGKWSIDVDHGEESGQLGLDYEMSDSHTVLPETETAVPVRPLVAKWKSRPRERIEDSF